MSSDNQLGSVPLQKSKPSHNSDSGVRSIGKALEVLSCFTSDQPEWGVTEIAEFLGLYKSAVHRIFNTCEQFGFVERTESHRYRLGARILELGNVYKVDRRFLIEVEPQLRLLAEDTEAVVHLAQLDGRDVLELLRSSAPGSVMFTRSPTFRMPVHATALGKVLLAFRNEQTIEKVIGNGVRLKKFTVHTIVEPHNLREELRCVRERGYAISDQESTLGCRCVAVPIRSRSNDVTAAISISGTLESFTEARQPSLVDRLLATARVIGRACDLWQGGRRPEPSIAAHVLELVEDSQKSSTRGSSQALAS